MPPLLQVPYMDMQLDDPRMDLDLDTESLGHKRNLDAVLS